jgi:hypothetical protein
MKHHNAATLQGRRLALYYFGMTKNITEQIDRLWQNGPNQSAYPGLRPALVQHIADIAGLLFSGESQLVLFEHANGLTAASCERPATDDVRTIVAAHRPANGNSLTTEVHCFSAEGHIFGKAQSCQGNTVIGPSVVRFYVGKLPDGLRMYSQTCKSGPLADYHLASVARTLQLLMDGQRFSDIFSDSDFARRVLLETHGAEKPSDVFFDPAIQQALDTAFPASS